MEKQFIIANLFCIFTIFSFGQKTLFEKFNVGDTLQIDVKRINDSLKPYEQFTLLLTKTTSDTLLLGEHWIKINKKVFEKIQDFEKKSSKGNPKHRYDLVHFRLNGKTSRFSVAQVTIDRFLLSLTTEQTYNIENN